MHTKWEISSLQNQLAVIKELKKKTNKQTKLDNFLLKTSPKSLRYNNNNNKWSYSQYFGLQDAQNALRKRIYKVSRSQGNSQKASDLTFALAFQNIPVRNIFMV